jgi:hypothetical protein
MTHVWKDSEIVRMSQVFGMTPVMSHNRISI